MVKINNIEIENVKRVKAVTLAPTENGLTVIGGENAQGKTSVLDAIAWALGGEKFRPGNAQNSTTTLPPYLKVQLSNGLIVERRGKNSSLTVTDPNGKRGGQTLLNDFVETLALNLPKFMQASSKEKADTLLRILGIGDKLVELERTETTLYNKRLAIGQIADQKKKYAMELPFFDGIPTEPVSVKELIDRQQAILLRNAENNKKRSQLQQIEAAYNDAVKALTVAQAELKRCEEQVASLTADLAEARKTAEQLQDESTAQIEQELANIESYNQKVYSNAEKQKAELDAENYQTEYNEYTRQIEDIRQERRQLLDSADMPLAGLSVEKGELIYNGQPWDCMSSSEQLKAATAIVRKLNPDCGFVLIDKTEQMDIKTLSEFGAWAEKEGLQIIATRVSTGDECSIIIEDGYIKPTEEKVTWKAGTF